MEYRPLGRTGVHVSKLCLGTMMFGAWGNTDHDDSIRIIHRALDAGINFVDTADVYSAGESEADRRQGPQGPPRRRRARHQVRRCRWSETPTTAAARAAGSSPRSRTPCDGSAPTGSTSTSSTAPTPNTDIDETLGALTDLVQQGKVRYIGSSSFSAGEIVEAQWRHASGASSASAPSSRRTRSWSAASSSTCSPPPDGTAWASSPTARWPAAGSREAGAPTVHRPPRRDSGWPHASTCRCPRTSASSKPSSSSPRSPTRPACRSSSSRSPSSSTTPP